MLRMAKNGQFFIKIAYNGHVIARIDKKSAKHDFVNNSTFPKIQKARNLQVYFRFIEYEFCQNI